MIRTITGVILAVVLLVLALAGKAASDLLSEELRGWLERTPAIILRMAAMHLGRDERPAIAYREEWLPELLFIMRRAEGRPISRFVVGCRYSLGLLRASRRITRDRRRAERRALANLPRGYTVAIMTPQGRELLNELDRREVPLVDQQGRAHPERTFGPEHMVVVRRGILRRGVLLLDPDAPEAKEVTRWRALGGAGICPSWMRP